MRDGEGGEGERREKIKNLQGTKETTRQDKVIYERRVST